MVVHMVQNDCCEKRSIKACTQPQSSLIKPLILHISKAIYMKKLKNSITSLALKILLKSLSRMSSDQSCPFINVTHNRLSMSDTFLPPEDMFVFR